jgi:hypothetical protein
VFRHASFAAGANILASPLAGVMLKPWRKVVVGRGGLADIA